ncbi:PIN-like domain-containing protein [Streptomyces sp. NPDC048595]|uniref:PIN-like domain-containing protein n=1 Tax=Streptomyces sp. NPDC048595 TaxID=3365576 RepID=UPI00371AB1BA
MSSFLTGFEGQWRRPADDYKTAVRTYLVAVDTNVLLELYRFTPDARHELLRALQALGDRLWVPHQVVTEYYGRRFDAVKEHIDLYSRVPKSLRELREKALQEIHTFAKRCSLSPEDKARLVEPVSEAFERVTDEISKLHGEFDLSVEEMVADDRILNSLAELLDGKTGEGFSSDESGQLLQEFKSRAQEKIPPGYKDAGKSDNAHGDFFLWEQLIRESERRGVDVLLVTNDAKEDWVKRQAGLIVGARPELIAEMRKRSGKDLLISQLAPFLQVVKEELGAAVSPSTVEQARGLEKEAAEPRIDDEEVDHLLERIIQGNVEGPSLRGLPYLRRADMERDLDRFEDALQILRNSDPSHWEMLYRLQRPTAFRTRLAHEIGAVAFSDAPAVQEDPAAALKEQIRATMAERDAAREAELRHSRDETAHDDTSMDEEYRQDRARRLRNYRMSLDEKLEDYMRRANELWEARRSDRGGQ